MAVVQDHIDRVIAVPFVLRANVTKPPWVSSAVRNPGLLNIQSRPYLIELVRGDSYSIRLRFLSGVYKSNSLNLCLLYFE